MSADEEARAERLAEARAQVHILEALEVAIDQPHRVLDVVLEAEDAADAVRRLERELGFSDVQATAVVDMQLRRVSRNDRARIRGAAADVRQAIAELSRQDRRLAT